MKRILVSLVIVSFAFIGANAHEGATGVVKTRMDMMGAVAQSMKTIGEMINGKSDFDKLSAKNATLEIIKHSKHFPKLFPADSIEKPSEALPVIWQDWDEFNAILEAMKTSANELEAEIDGATSTEDIKINFAKLGKTCGQCHEKFRLKK